MITVEEEKGGLRNIYFLSIFESIMQRVMEVSETCLRGGRSHSIPLVSRSTAFGMLGLSLLFGTFE